MTEKVDTEAFKQLERLREILRRYPGNSAVELALVLADGRKVLCECEIGVEVGAGVQRRFGRRLV